MFRRLNARMRDLCRDLMAEALHAFADTIRDNIPDPNTTGDPVADSYQWGQIDGITRTAHGIDAWADAITADKETTR